MRTVVKLARLLIVGFSLSLRRTLAFRVNLFFDVMMAVLALLSTLATVYIIFSRTDTLGGWTQPEMFLLIGTFELVSGLKTTFVDPNLESFPTRGIRDGRLDHQLLQPAPSLFLASLSTSAPLAGVQTLLGLAVVGLGVKAHDRPLSPAAIISWMVLVCLAVVIMWAVGTLLATLAFWAPRLDLQSLYGTAWQLGRYPTELFAKPVRFVLTYVLPLALVATVPAGALIRPFDPRVIIGSMIATVTVVLLTVGAWRRGLKQYTGATS
jgi:ABC-2 type transport system permease protein